MNPYTPHDIEKKWQAYWEEHKTFEVTEDAQKESFLGLIEFPYPSGAGLHVGHPRPFTAMDVICRKKRMEGKNVLFPIGFDAFGLPTENYAIKTGRPPAEVTAENIANFTRQLKALGYSFDWSRTVDTTDPNYYKWTQWIFLQLYKAGLAYKKNTPINWCLSCKIGLANEEVVDGRCERCGGAVEKRDKEQWMLAITAYADALLEGLNDVDYIERAKIQQRNWIGRKEGINITYTVENIDAEITCFTTRPDTNYGATFIVVAPESDFVRTHIDAFDNREKIDAYIQQARLKKDIDRIAEGRKKTGVATGLFAFNPLNERNMPIYVSDFVLATVGTGAVVGVPGHDLRDFEFAQAKELDIIRVVIGEDGDETPITQAEQVQEKAGTMINSGILNGLDIHDATEKIKDYIEENNWGKRVVDFKLRDWVFSRQRYWGEPIPLVYCEACAQKDMGEHKGMTRNPGWVPVPEDQLPITLPQVEKYEPTDTGESPLAAMEDWVQTTCPACGGAARRETDTMPNWAGSSWYWLRYMDPHNDTAFAGEANMKYWNQVNWYNGGMEHTVLHLLYSRFWNQFLFDQGLVPTKEPYAKRTSHGMILAKGGEKMSKSKGNVVNPDDMIAEYGTDALRSYIMFMGPFDQAAEWDVNGLIGVRRFLDRVWAIAEKVSDDVEEDVDIERILNQTIKKVEEDIENMGFNTAIAKMMELSNAMQKAGSISSRQYQAFIQILSPFAPHMCEELWERFGQSGSVAFSVWPTYDESKLVEDNFTLVVQVNGKVRASVSVSREITQEDAKSIAMAQENVVKWLEGKEPKKVIYVPGKLVSIVV